MYDLHFEYLFLLSGLTQKCYFSYNYSTSFPDTWHIKLMDTVKHKWITETLVRGSWDSKCYVTRGDGWY